MTIQIIPLIESASKPKYTIVGAPPLLLYADPSTLYTQRIKRFNHLADSNPFAEYLHFSAQITQAQQQILPTITLHNDLKKLLDDSAKKKSAPLDCLTFPRSSEWKKILIMLIDILSTKVSPNIVHVLTALKQASDHDIESIADDILAQRFDTTSSDKALFIWAALSVYWLHLASQLAEISQPKELQGENRQFCPICHSPPVASIIHPSTHAGVRYLHCSLCETEWYLPRVKCSNCENMANLTYFSLDSVETAVKTEACLDCKSYLKILYQDKDPAIETVADDLASLALDAKMEEEGFSHSGLNPYLFPGKIEK